MYAYFWHQLLPWLNTLQCFAVNLFAYSLLTSAVIFSHPISIYYFCHCYHYQLHYSFNSRVPLYVWTCCKNGVDYKNPMLFLLRRIAGSSLFTGCSLLYFLPQSRKKMHSPICCWIREIDCVWRFVIFRQSSHYIIHLLRILPTRI